MLKPRDLLYFVLGLLVAPLVLVSNVSHFYQRNRRYLVGERRAREARLKRAR